MGVQSHQDEPAAVSAEAESPRSDQHDRAKPSTGILHRLRRGIIIVLLTYVGVSLLITMLQSHLIYFPTRGYAASPSDVGLEYENLTLTTNDNVAIAAWFVTHADAGGTVVFCHGNAGNMADRLHSVKLLHRMGVNVLIFDYRGYGDSDGKPDEDGTYEDVHTVWRYLTEQRGEPPERIVLFGRSLGGAIAIELAHRLSSDGGVPGGLVVESSFTSLADIGKLHYPLLPVRLILTYHYASIEKVPHISCPKLFFHGEADTLIPLANGRELFKASAEPKQFVTTPGDHNEGGFAFSPEYTDRMAKFVQEVLVP